MLDNYESHIYSLRFLGYSFWRARLKSGEGNGTPLQYSCLENPMDKGPWWAAVQGVAKSRTRLKRLSSSSSSRILGSLI